MGCESSNKSGLLHARDKGLKVCIPSIIVWMGIGWQITGRSILNLCTTMYPPKTWMEGSWSNMQSLGRWAWAIVCVSLIAVLCNGLTSGHIFAWRSIWVLLLLGHVFTSARVDMQFIAICRYGCLEGNLDMEDNDDEFFAWHWDGRHLHILLRYRVGGIEHEIF